MSFIYENRLLQSCLHSYLSWGFSCKLSYELGAFRFYLLIMLVLHPAYIFSSLAFYQLISPCQPCPVPFVARPISPPVLPPVSYCPLYRLLVPRCLSVFIRCSALLACSVMSFCTPSVLPAASD